jgi:hypothetical protein
MTTPRVTPTVLTDPPDAAGTAAPIADPALRAGPPASSVSHAWDDQEIDIAGTEADLWFPPGDGSV